MAKLRLSGSYFGIVRAINGNKVIVWVPQRHQQAQARLGVRRVPRATRRGLISFDRPRNGTLVPELRVGAEVYGPIKELRGQKPPFGFQWLALVNDLVRERAVVGPFSATPQRRNLPPPEPRPRATTILIGEPFVPLLPLWPEIAGPTGFIGP